MWDDLVILKWVMVIDVLWSGGTDLKPADASGRPMALANVEYVIGKIKARPLSSINFGRRIEVGVSKEALGD